MKILLTTLNSKYIHSNLALKYLYGVVAQSGCNVELKEFTINNEDNYIYTELVRANYDIVCFSCYIWNIEKIKIICENLKKAKPEVKILVGGPEVSYDSVTFMEENPAIDYLLRGEGEYPFFQFCKNIVLEDDDFSSVGGMVFRKDGEITVNPQGETPDFEKVPFPYEALDCETDKVLYYEASRGCPYRCSYCLSSIDKTIKALPLERVRRDLGYFIFKEVKQVKFIDRTFNFDRERAYSIWKYLIDNDNGTTNFHFEICGELLDEKTLDLLGKARKDLFQFEIGIQ
ncbi:MAG: cobalamin-dependent protein, partial [Anaerovoracaceae bacterium]